jgi:hypothetical protein
MLNDRTRSGINYDESLATRMRNEHAECAAFYLLQVRPALRERRKLSDDEEFLKIHMDGHSKIGLKLSPNYDVFEDEVKMFIRTLTDEMLIASEKKTLKDYVLKKDLHCFDVTARTGQVIKAGKKRRAEIE